MKVCPFYTSFKLVEVNPLVGAIPLSGCRPKEKSSYNGSFFGSNGRAEWKIKGFVF